MNASLGNHQVGVSAFWWVTDIPSATAVVEGLTGELRNAEGGGYETDFNAVRARLNLALAAEEIVMDPFDSLVRTRRR